MNELIEYEYQDRIKTLEGEVRHRDAQIRDLVGEKARLELITKASTRELKPPRWLTPKRTPKDKHVATIFAMLSDCHFDEVVNPAELSNHNAYNREIAEYRLNRFFTSIPKLTREYISGVKYDGIVLALGGDIISGTIHHELTETNEGTSLETALHWTERIAAGIELLADTYGKVFVPCTVGNHGRLTMKPRSKKRVRDNIDWLISQMLARHFAKDDRVDFLIPDDIDVTFEIYKTKFLLYHGETGGGSGIGGIWPPIMRLRAKKATRWDFDVMCIGHWHQLIHAPEQGLIVNGSLKGYDEWTNTMAFRPEPPKQSMFLVTPESGITIASPIHVSKREDEGW